MVQASARGSQHKITRSFMDYHDFHEKARSAINKADIEIQGHLVNTYAGEDDPQRPTPQSEQFSAQLLAYLSKVQERFRYERSQGTR